MPRPRPAFVSVWLRAWACGIAALAGLAGPGGTTPAAHAAETGDVMPKPDEALDYLAPTTMVEAQPRWRAAAPQAGAAWGGFLVWPSLGAAGLVDTNPLQSHGGHDAAAGLRLTPGFVAEQESGVHATTLYGTADALLFPARPDADELDGRVGVLHDWAPRRDIIVRLQGDVAQARDAIDSRTAVTGSDRGRPFATRTATLATSVQKTFDRLFVSVGGEAVHTSFLNGPVRTRIGTPALSDQSGTDLKGRAGFWLTPAVYAFAEPAADWRVLDAVAARSTGTRLVGGFGTDRAALLAGELFAGEERQTFSRAPRQVSEPVFGARLAWRPTPAWTVSLVADRALQQAAVGTAAQPLGTPVDAIREGATLRFAPSASWWAELALEHTAIRYLGSQRLDDLIGADAEVAIPWRHDLEMTAEIAVARVRSTLALAGYDRANVTLGARYRY